MRNTMRLTCAQCGQHTADLIAPPDTQAFFICWECNVTKGSGVVHVEKWRCAHDEIEVVTDKVALSFA